MGTPRNLGRDAGQKTSSSVSRRVEGCCPGRPGVAAHHRRRVAWSKDRFPPCGHPSHADRVRETVFNWLQA